MISSLELKFGSGPEKLNLTVEPTSITVFIGPNNSGKSKTILEIFQACSSGGINTNNVVLKDISFTGFSSVEAEQQIVRMEVPAPESFAVGPNNVLFRRNGNIQQVNKNLLLRSLIDPNNKELKATFCVNYLGPKILMLSGKNRIDLANSQPGGDLQEFPKTSLQKLFRDDLLRRRFSNVIYKGLGSYAVIDPTNLGQLRLRLSKSAPESPEVERGLGASSVAFHADAQLISDASDGAKAFTGVIAEIMAGDPVVLLMDEPEAFLHPALAFNLGHEIARSLATTDKRLFVATHSPQFLMGCIQSGVAINVIRLTYQNNIAIARLLPSTELIRLMRKPLLRSVGVISALFYESVVVTEADPDRAFYQEINERLLRKNRGIPNCMFLNAQNKHTIPTILGPLRNLGIPTAAIYDIDFIKDNGGVATRFMETAGIPRLAQQGLTITRAALAKELLKADNSYKTTGGISVLADADRAAAEDYFSQLDAYGAFIIRGGELESWLKAQNVTGHGPTWLVSMFEKMGEDPDLPDYLEPTQNDVWSFVDQISVWLLKRDRKGIPN